ncbi:MAG: Periplasmic serine protease, ClpP class [Verrucomicrobiota bacterium]
MSEKRSGCVTSILVVVLVISGVLNLALILAGSAKLVRGTGAGVRRSASFHEPVVKSGEALEGEGGKRVAVISIRGVINSAEPGSVGESALEDTLEEIAQARTDDTVAAVVLRIDSPGGEVTASDILYRAVRQLREKKPVVVSMDSVAASGGYYVACAGTHVFAHETTLTASIGVIMQALNYQHLLGKVGLEVVTFKSGAFKDMLNGARELTEAEREYVQGMINQSYDRFVGIVARERRLEEGLLRKGVADGRIVSGRDALSAGLVDEIGGFEEALEKARALGKAPGAAAIRYTAPMALGRLLRFLNQAPAKGGKVEVDFGGRLQGKLENGRIYYLSSLLVP